MTLTYDSPPRRWNVDNYGEGGPGVPVDLVEATVRSYNTVYAQLILEVGAERAIEHAARLGITTPLEAAPAAVLGANDVQPLEMASSFGTLANRGVRVDPVLVTRVDAVDGRTLYESKALSERVLEDRKSVV
jgi:membrane peptidoglycan carboxypeptidase